MVNDENYYPIRNVCFGKYPIIFTSFCCVLLIISFMSFSAFAQQDIIELNDGIDTPIVVGFKKDMFDDADLVNVNAVIEYWMQVIGNQTGNSTKGVLYDDIASIIRDLEEGKVDLMNTSPEEFMEISPKAEVELAYARVINGKKTQKNLVLVRADTPYTELNQLKGKTLSFKKSNKLGMMYLNTLLLKNKLPESENFFSLIIEKDKTSRAVLAVFFKSVDVCIVVEEIFDLLVELNPQIGKDLRIIDSSPEYINYVGFFRKNYDNQAKEKTMRIMTSLNDIPKGDQILKLFRSEGVEKIDESDFTTMKELFTTYTNLKGNNNTSKK